MPRCPVFCEADNCPRSTECKIVITLLRPSFRIETETDPLLVIEKAARVCYKSENRICEGSAEHLIRKLLTVLKHESVIEHSNVILRVPRHVWLGMREWRPSILNEESSASTGFLHFTGYCARHLVSGNFRAWRDLFITTDSFASCYRTLRALWPAIFDSIKRPRYNAHYDGHHAVMLSSTENLSPLERLEHEVMTVKFITDRGVTHELVRHRPPAFSQESTRYCNYGKSKCSFILPATSTLPPGDYEDCASFGGNDDYSAADIQWLLSLEACANYYNTLLALGWKPQQARGVLPNALKTEIYVTANLREWRHIFRLRTAATAHPQMQEVMCPLLYATHARYPGLFDDLVARNSHTVVTHGELKL